MNNTKCTVKTCRLLTITALVLISMFGLSSCIQEEALNAECDIISAKLKDWTFFEPPRIDNDSITFVVKEMPTSTLLSLKDVELTPGATISPDPSIKQDFSDSAGNSVEVEYTVTAQDGFWSKDYTVRLVKAGIPSVFSFDEFDTVYSTTAVGTGYPGYDVFYEIHNYQKLDIWASGNAGYRIANGSATPSQYPTYAAVGEGILGDSNAAKLVTLSTGFTSPLPELAAGSLYLGTFDVNLALFNPRGSTKFGVPFNKKPTSIKGWYKYTAGTDFVGEGVTSDEPSIFAVLYEPTPEKPFLDGDNILDSPQIVAIAEVEKPTADDWVTTTYASFSADFAYIDTDTTITKRFDPALAKDFGYKITLVFSSSKDGADFKGAVGSTLYIDEVTLTATEIP